MNRTFKIMRHIRGADKASIEAGTLCVIRFNQDRPDICTVHPANRLDVSIPLASARLPSIFDEIEPAPDEDELEELVVDSVCPSVFGDEVEPDGWDQDGSPSWLLALGLI